MVRVDNYLLNFGVTQEMLRWIAIGNPSVLHLLHMVQDLLLADASDAALRFDRMTADGPNTASNSRSNLRVCHGERAFIALGKG